MGSESLLTHKDIFISFRQINLRPGIRVRLTVQTAVGALKAVAEPTRLRVLVLLSAGELNVKDLTRILGQSQPRISRHLKLLAEAGLVERAPEGSWVYFRLAETGQGGELARLVLERIDRSDPLLVRDLRRAEAPAAGARRPRRRPTSSPMPAIGTASARCTSPRPRWRRPCPSALGAGPFDLFVDLGTGTGRMLELFGDALPARPRPRPQPRHAGLCARQARARRPAACAGAPGRHLRSAARRSELRTPSSCTRCCTS